MSIGTVIPDLDNTLSPEEVRRKTFEEKYATAFNKDQREILDALIGGGGGSSVSWEQKVTEGVNIADITVDDETIPVYAPEGGGGEQVQADWSQSDDTAVDFIKNKPTIPAAQVQADWSVTNSSSKAFIKNKPTIPTIPAHMRVLFAGHSASVKDLTDATSVDDAVMIYGFDDFNYTVSNWRTVTPAKFYLLFPNSVPTHYKLYMVCDRNSSLSSGEVRYTITHDGTVIGYLALVRNTLELWFTSSGFAAFFDSDVRGITGVNNVFNLINPENRRLSGYNVTDSDNIFAMLDGFNRYNSEAGRVGILVFYEM